MGEGIAFTSRIDEEAVGGCDVGASGVKALLELRAQAAFDFDGPAVSAGQGQDEVDFGTSGRAVEAGLGALRRHGDQGLDDKTLPARSCHGMGEKSVLVGDAE